METRRLSKKDIREMIRSYIEVRYYMCRHKCKESDIEEIDGRIEKLKAELERRK